MQRVSEAYKKSMKSSLRERSYIMLSFGLINQEAQSSAKISNQNLLYLADTSKIFNENKEETVYCSLEENFTKIDGSMFFPPRRNSLSEIYKTSLISDKLISEEMYLLNINFDMKAKDIKGITIDFGENYPINFDILGVNEQKIEIRNNNQSLFVTEEVFNNTNLIKLKIYKMKNTNSRLRIYSIRFGYGLVYYNDSVLDSKLDSYVSPIGAYVPQIDFSVQLKNYNSYFNVDNPKSAINFLETGQEMRIYYGYKLPDSSNIEWVKGNRLLCSEWESDDYTATIRCQDIFRSMDKEYYRGNYSELGKSFYELCRDILSDIGETDYYIDPRLKLLITKNPIPRVRHKEALQIIANACRCVLTQTRDGKVQIKSAFVPLSTVSCNGETDYSKVTEIMNDTAKAEYAKLSTNYTVADGSMYFIPRNISGKVLNTSYVSSSISREDGSFAENPILTFKQEAACMYHGLKIVFGNAVPAKMIIRTYKDENLIDEYFVEDEYTITKKLIIYHRFEDFDTMTIEFTKTAEPFNHIVVNNFSFGNITDFTMERIDMTNSPTAIKQELVKEIIVPCYSLQKGNIEESLFSEEIEAKAGAIETFFVGEASYGFKAKFNDIESNVSIIESGNYFIKVKFNITGKFRLLITGYSYKIIERNASIKLNERGKTIKWKNPLISEMDMAQDLAKWLVDYYKSGIEYEYDTRGNPEIDVNDIVYQENEFHKNMKVNIYRTSLRFAQSFSGKITARRVGA